LEKTDQDCRSPEKKKRQITILRTLKNCTDDLLGKSSFPNSVQYFEPERDRTVDEKRCIEDLKSSPNEGTSAPPQNLACADTAPLKPMTSERSPMTVVHISMTSVWTFPPNLLGQSIWSKSSENFPLP
jgi:hypothetical protein